MIAVMDTKRKEMQMANEHETKTNGGEVVPFKQPLKSTLVDSPTELMRRATDVAGACKTIVKKTALEIEGRKYVKIEGWQAIATSFGYVLSARDVEKVFDPSDDRFLGFRAIGEVKRVADGAVISQAEGFVGVDEVRWFGGERDVWNRDTRKMETKMYMPAPEYAARAMCQTRGMSRAGRSAFAFVVVLIDTGLSTTPAEEIEPGDEPHGQEKRAKVVTPTTDEPPTTTDEPPPPTGKRWQQYTCSYGTKNGPLRGRLLGELTDKNLDFLHGKFVDQMPDDKAEALSNADKAMREGLILWRRSERLA